MSLLKKLVPSAYRPTKYLSRLATKRCNGRVASGPFVGMSYVDRSFGSVFLPKLIGCYEKELAPVCEEIISRKPKFIVDIGAAEGYYAVGLAMRCADSHVFAFEMDQGARTLLERLAALNGCSKQVEIAGAATPDALKALGVSGENTVVICDCEGAEYELLDPGKVPWLMKSSILVEIHDWVITDIDQIILQRFQSSHSILRISQVQRVAGDYPFVGFLTNLMPRLLINNRF